MFVLGSSLVTTIVLAVVLVISSLVAGVLIGLQIARPSTKTSRTDQPEAENTDTDSEESVDTERVKALLLKLHEVSTGVAGNVRDHNETIHAITSELERAAASGKQGAALTDDIDILKLVADIVDANSKLQDQLVEATEIIEDQARELQCQLEEAFRDPLTEIANRRAFDHELDRRLAEHRRTAAPVALLMLDVDHFKQFNDRYGHRTGDEVLRGVASLLQQEMREMDLPARYGGEEFGAVLPQTSMSEAQKAAERVRKAIESTPFESEHGPLKVTVSIGVAIAQDGDQPGKLVERADMALYAAKRGGRNRSYYHDGNGCHPVGAPSNGPNHKNNASDQAARAAGSAAVDPAPDEEPRASSQGQTIVVEDSPAPPSPEGTLIRTDPLTGLPNRQAFTEELHRRLAECRRHGSILSIVVLQIDRFDEIKRRHGPEAGRLIIQQVPRFLAAAMRESDLIARYDEAGFAVLLPASELQGAAIAAERVRTAIAMCDKLRVHDEAIRFTASLGVAQASGDDGVTSIIGRAQLALYAAAERGGNRTFVCDGIHCEDATSQQGTIATFSG